MPADPGRKNPADNSCKHRLKHDPFDALQRLVYIDIYIYLIWGFITEYLVPLGIRCHFVFKMRGVVVQ